jgi:hypothetical protein
MLELVLSGVVWRKRRFGMTYSPADMQEMAAEYYLALCDMMNHALGDRHWAKNVASDFKSARKSAQTKSIELFDAEYFSADLLLLFQRDFAETFEITALLRDAESSKDIVAEEQTALINQAHTHRLYLEEQANSYLAMLTRLLG